MERTGKILLWEGWGTVERSCAALVVEVEANEFVSAARLAPLPQFANAVKEK